MPGSDTLSATTHDTRHTTKPPPLRRTNSTATRQTPSEIAELNWRFAARHEALNINAFDVFEKGIVVGMRFLGGPHNRDSHLGVSPTTTKLYGI